MMQIFGIAKFWQWPLCWCLFGHYAWYDQKRKKKFTYLSTLHHAFFNHAIFSLSIFFCHLAYVSYYQLKLQQNFKFDTYSPSNSSTSKKVFCSDDLCGQQNACTSATSSCPYNISYLSADTSSSGVLVQDILYLTTEHANPEVVEAPIVFGYAKFQLLQASWISFIASSNILMKWFNSTVVETINLVHFLIVLLPMVYLDLDWRRYQCPAFWQVKGSLQIPSPCVLEKMVLGESILETKVALTNKKLHSLWKKDSECLSCLLLRCEQFEDSFICFSDHFHLMFLLQYSAVQLT